MDVAGSLRSMVRLEKNEFYEDGLVVKEWRLLAMQVLEQS
jgi:hypothetical protein